MEPEQFMEADIFAMPEPGSGTDTRVFRVNGKDKAFTIEANGHQFGERWAELFQCQMYGQTQKMIAQASKQTYSEEFDNPGSKKIVITDPSYMGSLKLLHAVLVAPKMPFGSLVIFGHRAGGKLIDEIASWAADKNGVSEYAQQKLIEISKNLLGGMEPLGESVPPA